MKKLRAEVCLEPIALFYLSMRYIDLVSPNKISLGAVETGVVTLIGATTENPSFEVIPALLSRCQVYTLEHFSKEDLQHLLKRAISEDEKLARKEIVIKEDKALLRLSGGDARKLLNVFELIVNSESSHSDD